MSENPLQVFVINLKRRPDRLERVKQNLPQEWLTAAEFTTDWPGPVDGQLISSENIVHESALVLYEGWQLPESGNDWWSRPMKMGEIGCAFSHLSVWRRAQEKFATNPSLKWTLIFEDDVHVNQQPGVTSHLNAVLHTLDVKNPNWDLLYVGRVLQRSHHDGAEIFDGVVEPGFSYCLYSYVLSRRGVSKLLSCDFQEALVPVDEFIPACYTMHPRRDISQLYPPILEAYALKENLVFQYDKNVLGSDTEDSKFFTRKKPRVRVVSNWTSCQNMKTRLIEQCLNYPGSENEKFELVTDEDYEWLVIFNGTIEKIKVPRERVIGFIQEPPFGDFFDFNLGNLCDVVYTCGEAEAYRARGMPGNFIGFPLGMFYLVDGSPGEYLALTGKEKDQVISMVCSGNSGGFYDKRLAIAQELATVTNEDGTPWCDMYGRGLKVPGAKGGLQNKAEALRHHKFTVCVENGICEEYISEKLIDAVLCLSIPIYVGARRVKNHVPFVIDLSAYHLDPARLVQEIQQVVANTCYEDYVDQMKEWRQFYFEHCSLYGKIEQHLFPK